MVLHRPLREIPLQTSSYRVISVYLISKVSATLSRAFCPVARDVARLLTRHDIAVP